MTYLPCHSGLYAKLKKKNVFCDFQVESFGYIILNKSLMIDSKKIKTINK